MVVLRKALVPSFQFHTVFVRDEVFNIFLMSNAGLSIPGMSREFFCSPPECSGSSAKKITRYLMDNGGKTARQ
jgi:hypothetical protein